MQPQNKFFSSHSLMSPINIAIDGPAGAGKSTVARKVALQLAFVYVDTGAMYRVIAWLAIQHGFASANEDSLELLTTQSEIHFEQSPDGLLDAFVNGRKMGSELRTPEVSTLVSKISVFPKIRQKLTDWQRDFAKSYSVVMDGRDIGTVVLPHAQVKIFLTANIEERARRRFEELRNKGFEVSISELMTSIQERDARDSNRDVAPLKPADDAIIIDTSGKSVDRVVDEVLELVRQVTHE
jgi:CMP/dCMP kinase